MKRIVFILALLFLPSFHLFSRPQPAGNADGVRLNGHTFTLPPDFEIELVAGPPLVDRPIAAAFDEQGRLYVSESSGSSEPVKVQLEKKPHRILRLEDVDGDGKFDKRTVFADRMMFPEGVMWFRGSVYVAAPPVIWKLTDTDDDGVADRREVWFDGKTLTGCANDLHGPYPGPDGWIYWCKGAFAEQKYELHGNKTLVTKAAHIFRAKPDGSNVEPVMTGGMDNPVDVVFTPGGERIFTTTFLQFPGGGKRDGLIHAVYGGIYGKDFYVIYDHIWTGPSLMPVLTHLGAAAPCGLCRYKSSVFGKDYQDNLFACLFNMQKVTRHALHPHGATFKSEDSDFVVSDRKDFHPTDVIEDADGSLLVVDTGGWYKLCCPTSQLYKPDILGGIYRVRKKNAPKAADPRGLNLSWATMSSMEIASLLDDPRPAVRERAIDVLAQNGAKALPAVEVVLRKSASARARRNAVWTATRIDDKQARAVVRLALKDPDETVRQAAIHSTSVWRDDGAVPDLLPLLKNNSVHNRRAAAEALGRIGHPLVALPILEATADHVDRVLDHSLTYALIEIGDANQIGRGLDSPNPYVRRAAMTALDQIEKSNLESKCVIAELSAEDVLLKETAWWLASRHPEWGADLSAFLQKRLLTKSLSASEKNELVQLLAKLARSSATQKLFVDLLLDEKETPSPAKELLLQAMAQSGLREAPPDWVAALTQILEGKNADLAATAIRTTRKLRLPRRGTEKLIAALTAIGHDSTVSTTVRLNALAALPQGLKKMRPELFSFLLDRIKPNQPVLTRALAAEILARAKLDNIQLVSLADSLREIGPLEANRLLDAFAQSKQEKIGRALLDALKGAPVRSGLYASKLKTVFAKYPSAVQQDAEKFYASLKVDAQQQKAQLEKLLPLVKTGDAQRGQIIFNSTKAACASCHSIGYLGGKIGPDLTRIARIRSERDLLEAILFPSASFVQSYEPVVVATTNGKVHNGIVQKETAEEVTLVIAADQKMMIPREEIEEMLPSSVSIMPAGLDKQMTPQELADLVAFLKACK